jgi:probable phosphoglycerate mutase
MKLILVRHAVTAETGRRLSGRNPGIALSAAGVAAATDLAANLAGTELAAVYASPIQRCRETAAVLARPHGLKPRIRQGLIEVEYGAWSGRTLRSLYRLRAWKTLMQDPIGFRFPEGETLDEVRRRAVRTVERLATKHAKEVVLAVSHGDVIRSIVAHSLSESTDLIHRLHVSPLGVTVLETDPDGRLHLNIVNAPRL